MVEGMWCEKDHEKTGLALVRVNPVFGAFMQDMNESYC